MATVKVYDQNKQESGEVTLGVRDFDHPDVPFRSRFGNKTTSFKPFPHISPNKTWEGTFTGVFLGIVAAVLWTNYVLPTATDSLKMCFLWIPLFAVAGDPLESYFKRRAGVKDANDFLLDKPVIGQIEGLLGGQGGHGGYLDRLDSFSFVLFLLVLVDIFCNLCY